MLLLSGETRTGLAAARSLVRNGVPFVVVGVGPPGMLARSRAVERRVVGPSPSAEPDAFARFLADAAEQTGARVALPTYDNALRAASLHRPVLEAAGLTLAAASPDAVSNVLDKRANLATARRLGIPCPAQVELDDRSGIPDLVDALGFPMVLKPPLAGAHSAGQPFAFKWLVARDETELRALLDRHCSDGALPLFQECLRGTVVGLYCLAARGELVHPVLSLKGVRRAHGENVLREVVEPDPELLAHTAALARELEYDGPLNTSFFVTSSGRAHYMETNGRLWGNVAGAIRVGYDFPYWTVRYFRDGVLPEPPPAPLGSLATWRYGELKALVSVLLGEAWLTDRDHVTRRRALAEYVGSFRPGIHGDVFRLGDPLPELLEHWELIGPALGRRARSVATRVRRGGRRYDSAP